MNIKCNYSKIIEIKNLKPNPRNPNKHPEEQIKRLAQIIDYQGMRSPIVVSKRSGFITKGHGRLAALKLLGWESAPVEYQDYEDEAQEYADMVADNAIAEWAAQDLGEINTEVLDLGPDFDIDLLGIKDFVIEPVEKYDEEKEDDVPEVKHDPKTKKGDVWLLGEHRVMCGDSTMIDDVSILMNKNVVDMIFTDPPYGYSYESNHQDKHQMLKNDDEILNFLPVANVFMADNATIYLCTSHQVVEEWKPRLKEVFSYKNMIVWKKNNWSMGDLKGAFAGQHELVLFGSKGKNKIIGKRDTDIWEFKRVPPEKHPTMKPVEMVEYAMSKWQSGKVLDLFLGSGSTLIACEKTNRKCYGMELDEHYCDVIVERWQKYTGKKAILESTGTTYGETT